MGGCFSDMEGHKKHSRSVAPLQSDPTVIVYAKKPDIDGKLEEIGTWNPAWNHKCFHGVRKTDDQLEALERYLKIDDNANRYCGTCGATLLQRAVRNRQEDVVHLLLSTGANMFKNKDGQCPLDIAKEKGYHTIVQLIERALLDFADVPSSSVSSQPSHAADSQLLPSAPPLPILPEDEEEDANNEEEEERQMDMAIRASLVEAPNFLGPSSSLGTSSSYIDEFYDYLFKPAYPGWSYYRERPASDAPNSFTSSVPSHGESSQPLPSAPPLAVPEEDTDDEQAAQEVAIAIMVSLEPDLQKGIIPQLSFWRNEPTGEASSSSAPLQRGQPTGSQPPAQQTPNGSSSSRDCEYCCDAPIEATCDPCGHVACCNCWLKIQDTDNKCPYCRASIKKIIKLFL